MSCTEAADAASWPSLTESVGVLGHQSPAAALDCLRRAPLLEDLGAWSHWDLVYRPQFGQLSDFLLGRFNPGGNTAGGGGVSALEISPGKLLKISASSTVQDFYGAVDSFDAVNTSGHLVSLVVARGNARDVSAQLLANHVLASLQRRLAEDGGDCGGDGEEEGSALEGVAGGVVSRFVFDCLCRIPVRICELIANEVSTPCLYKDIFL